SPPRERRRLAGETPALPGKSVGPLYWISPPLALSPLLRRGEREFNARCRVSHCLLGRPTPARLVRTTRRGAGAKAWPPGPGRIAGRGKSPAGCRAEGVPRAAGRPPRQVRAEA